MNNKILQRVIEELKKKEPSIPYVLGMLETLSEMTGQVQVASTHPIIQAAPVIPSVVVQDDEHRILEAETKAKLSDVMSSIKYE